MTTEEAIRTLSLAATGHAPTSEIEEAGAAIQATIANLTRELEEKNTGWEQAAHRWEARAVKAEAHQGEALKILLRLERERAEMGLGDPIAYLDPAFAAVRAFLRRI